MQLSFDAESAQWVMRGKADRQGMSKERRKIIEMLENANGPLPPGVIIAQVERSSSYTRKLLHDMVKAGEILQAQRGLYASIGTSDI